MAICASQHRGLTRPAAGPGSGRRVGWFELGGLDGGRGFGLVEADGDGPVSGDQFGDRKLERLNALAGDGGDHVKRQLAAFREGGELLELVGVGDISFGGDQNGGFGGKGRVEGLEFCGDDLKVGDGIGTVGRVGDIDQVDDDRGALDVA